MSWPTSKSKSLIFNRRSNATMTGYICSCVFACNNIIFCFLFLSIHRFLYNVLCSLRNCGCVSIRYQQYFKIRYDFESLTLIYSITILFYVIFFTQFSLLSVFLSSPISNKRTETYTSSRFLSAAIISFSLTSLFAISSLASCISRCIL